MSYSEIVAKQLELHHREMALRRAQNPMKVQILRDSELKRAKWQEIRKQGRIPFVLTRGILVCGLPLFAIYNGIHIFVLGHSGFKEPTYLVITGTIWCAFACFEQIKTWNANEKRFAQPQGSA